MDGTSNMLEGSMNCKNCQIEGDLGADTIEEEEIRLAE